MCTIHSLANESCRSSYTAYNVQVTILLCSTYATMITTVISAILMGA
jgi:hypothetical protein